MSRHCRHDIGIFLGILFSSVLLAIVIGGIILWAMNPSYTGPVPNGDKVLVKSEGYPAVRTYSQCVRYDGIYITVNIIPKYVLEWNDPRPYKKCLGKKKYIFPANKTSIRYY